MPISSQAVDGIAIIILQPSHTKKIAITEKMEQRHSEYEKNLHFIIRALVLNQVKFPGSGFAYQLRDVVQDVCSLAFVPPLLEA